MDVSSSYYHGKQAAWNIGLGIVLIYLAFLPPGIYAIDGNSMLRVAESLVIHQNVTVPPNPETGIGVLGPDGNYYSIWYPLLSFLGVPFVALGLVLESLSGLPRYYAISLGALLLPVLLTGATSVLIMQLVVQLGGTPRRAYLATIAFAFGTIALVYGRTFFAEMLLAFLTTAGIYLILKEETPYIIGASVVAGLLVLAKPPGLILGPILSLYLLFKRRSFALAVLPTIGTVIGLVLFSLYSFLRFGSNVPYEVFWVFHPVVIADSIIGFFFSPGAGLFWYCSPVIPIFLGSFFIKRGQLAEWFLLLGIFVGYMLIYTILRSRGGWYGGWSWGPRFLMPALPPLFASVALINLPSLDRWLSRMTIVGFFIQAPTLVAFYERYLAEADFNGISYEDMLWSFFYAPWVRLGASAYNLVQDALKYDVAALIQTTPTQSPIPWDRMLHIVALWWWILPAVGIPQWVGAFVAAGMVGTGVWLLRREWSFIARGTADVSL